MTKALIAMANSKTAITNLIGSSPMRLYPILLPQGLSTFPAAAFRVNNNVPHDDFDGASTHDFGHIDLWGYGKTYAEADKVWDTFRTELTDTTGVFAGIEITGVRYIDSGQEDYLDDLELYTKQLELSIDYLRLQP